jgi:Zn-dependent M28 family amino/carboxypeptidase
LLFEGSGHSFAEVAALSDASRTMPRFPLKGQLTATVTSSRRAMTSPNVVGHIAGTDRRLKGEHVVLTAHLDHLGVGAPIAGDRIYNGAMDNAAGVATLLDVAERLKAGPAPKRSVLIVLVTAEEGGLLGSGAFASAPTVPKRSVVANLNFDMALPLFPLKSIIALGAEESTLGATARHVGERIRLPIVPDPLPDRNSFIRSDQYSFVRNGIPALAFKFGFAKDTPEARIEAAWRSTRYHAPSDDLSQPGIHKEDAIRLDDYVAELTREIANAPARPRWLATSIFGR